MTTRVRRPGIFGAERGTAGSGTAGSVAGGSVTGERATPGRGPTGTGTTEPGGTGRAAGMALMLGGGLSNQLGAATGALAFPVIGPAGVVAVRQWVAGVVLLLAGRPRLRSFTARQWRPVLGLAAVFATMNLSLYTAIDHIGLGLAVTLEFLGPLAVALIASRRMFDLGCALAAAAAVVVLVRPQPSTDYPGIALALVAAVCWGCYILLNRTVGRRVPGVQGSAAAAAVSAVAYLPIGVLVLARHPPTVAALCFAVAAGVLSSVVPFLADLLALRRVPAQFFGVFMSVNPVLAALVGAVVLQQRPGWVEWAAIVVIVGANALATLSAARHSSPRHEPSSRADAGSWPLSSGAVSPAPAPATRSCDRGDRDDSGMVPGVSEETSTTVDTPVDDKAHIRHKLDFTDAEWITSTEDDDEPGVEIAFVDGYIGMRNGAEPEGPILVFTPEEWDAFVAGAKDGEFDEP